MGHVFSFDIEQVAVTLLQMKVKRPCSDGFYTDCPFCKDTRAKLKIKFGKNVFRCNYCNKSGGMLKLYGMVHGISNSDALQEINEALRTGNNNQIKNDYFTEMKKEKQSVPIPQSELANIEIIDHTLTSLLNLLQLSKQHRQNLINRGLTDEQIDKLGYKSTPSPDFCLSLTQQLIKQGCTVKGVPGFYMNKYGKWTVKFYKKTAGIIVPIRNIERFISGLQIRLDVPITNENDSSGKQETKYIWFSSSNKHMGTTSGSPVHFNGNPFAKTIYITEGALKGDIANFLTNRSFLCIAGANNVNQLNSIFAKLAQNGTKTIIEAYDMDKYSNEMVHKGASLIYNLANEYNLEFKRLTWNPNYKGIDDWQLALKLKSQKSNKIYKGNLGNRQKFRIYQLDFANGHTIKFAFKDIKFMHKLGYDQPPASEYRLIHNGEIFYETQNTENEILKLIFEKYNNDVPNDYIGRYIAPSDVVELYDDEKRQYFYCESTGFVPVNFFPVLVKPIKLQ